MSEQNAKTIVDKLINNTAKETRFVKAEVILKDNTPVFSKWNDIDGNDMSGLTLVLTSYYDVTRSSIFILQDDLACSINDFITEMAVHPKRSWISDRSSEFLGAIKIEELDTAA